MRLSRHPSKPERSLACGPVHRTTLGEPECSSDTRSSTAETRRPRPTPRCAPSSRARVDVFGLDRSPSRGVVPLRLGIEVFLVGGDLRVHLDDLEIGVEW